MSADEDRVTEAIEGPLGAHGILVEEVRALAAGSHRTVRVVIDLAGDTAEPVSLETIAEATRIVGEATDDLPLFNDRPYTLEVTSPGADRPLTQPRHFARVKGRTLAVRTAAGKRAGELVAATGEHIVLRDGDGALAELPYRDIESAQVQLRFR